MPAIVGYTQAEILDLFSRIYPVEYWSPILEQVGDGLEIFQAISKVFSLLSAQIETFWRGSLITLAPAGALATATVEFFRETATAGAFSLLAGSVVTTSNGGRRFITQSDISFGALDLGPHEVAVTAAFPDEEYNVPGPATTAANETIPGEIDTIALLLELPILQDLTVQVRQVTDATGGVSPWLEQLGADRGLPRNPGEPVELYRWRIQQLPRVVTPLAIAELVNGVFSQIGFEALLVEQNSMEYQTCYDGPEVSDGDYDSTLFVYDDPRDPLPFRNRWLDSIEARGAFLAIVPALPSVTEVGIVYDDTVSTTGELVTILGSRAIGAYDVPSGLLAPYGVQDGCYDGNDAGLESFYQSLLEQLNAIKAWGVFVTLELAGQ